MTENQELIEIFNRLINNNSTEEDKVRLRQLLTKKDQIFQLVSQDGKDNTNINIGEINGGNIKIDANHYYQGADAKVIREVLLEVLELNQITTTSIPDLTQEELRYLNKLYSDAQDIINENNKILNRIPKIFKIQLREPTGTEQVVQQRLGHQQNADNPSHKNISIKNIIDVFNDRNSGRSVLLLGGAGYGKSTLLKKILKKFNLKNYHLPFPVFFSLSSYTKDYKNFTVWLIEQLYDDYQIPKNIAAELIRKQKLMLLLDGLDEVNEIYLRDCIKSVNNFIKDHGLTEIVLCTRIQEYQEILKSSPKSQLGLKKAFYIEPLTFDDMHIVLIKIYAICFLKMNVLSSLIELGSFNLIKHIASKIDNYQKIILLIRLFRRYKDLRNPQVIFIMINADINIETLNILTIETTLDNIIELLFNKYIEYMLEMRIEGLQRNKKYPEYYWSDELKPKIETWLKYLAYQLKQHGRRFQLERIQPSWLTLEIDSSEIDILIYLIYHVTTGLTIGSILGITAGLYFIYVTPYSIPMTNALVLKLIIIGLLSGLITGIITGVIKGIASYFIKNKSSTNAQFQLYKITQESRGISLLKNKINILFFTLKKRLIRGGLPGIIFGISIIIVFNLFEPKYLNNYYSAIFLSCVFGGMSFSLMRNEIKIPLLGKIDPTKILTSSLFFTVIGIFYTLCRRLLLPKIYEGKGWYGVYEVMIFSIVGVIYGATIIQQQYQPSDKPEKFNNGIIYLRNYAILSFVALTISGMLIGFIFDSVRSPVLICIGLVVGLLGGLAANEGAGIVCIQHFTLRVLLYLKGYIPWNYGQFLNYASEKFLLRKQGRNYEFINGLLEYYTKPKND